MNIKVPVYTRSFKGNNPQITANITNGRGIGATVFYSDVYNIQNYNALSNAINYLKSSASTDQKSIN